MKSKITADQRTTVVPGQKSLKRKKFWSDVFRDKQLYIMLIPFVLYYILFHYVPMFGLQMAFQNYKPFLGMAKSEWVGFEHFENFFSSPYASRVIVNSLLINVYDVAVNFTLTIVFAVLLNEIAFKKARTFVQTVMYMPHFISTVIVAGLVVTILSPSSGIINQFIEFFGGERVYFLAEPDYFRTIYVLMNSWAGVGFGTIIYTSSICSIDDSLYEAASIDGAGRFQKMWHITLPGIRSTIATMLILRMGSMLTVGAESVLLLYQPVTYETADVISTFVYRYGLVDGNYSYSTAVGIFNGLISLILVIAANKISKKVSESSLW